MNNILDLHLDSAARAFAGSLSRPLGLLQGSAGGSAHPAPAIHLDGFALDVRPGEIFGVIGPNGSGKSALVRLIAGMLAPRRGCGSIFGRNPAGEVGAVHQLTGRAALDAAFFQKLSPVENLLLGARQCAAQPSITHARVQAMLRRLALAPEDYYRPAGSLSRGDQQKVAIGRAFLAEPRVLLLDEPTSGLDPRARREVQALIRGLGERYATSVLLTTHDLAEAEALCDRIAVLNKGRLRALDTPVGLRQFGASLEEAYLALTGQPAASEEAVR
ncbi:MAG: ABC transporter ATP-binding protein [Anaerolineales bacterium]